MKPAICVICGKHCKDEKSPKRGDWVRFSDYQQPGPTFLNHPVGLEYFCDDHITSARDLASKTSKEAIAELILRYGVFPASSLIESPPEQMPLWRRFLLRKIRGD